MPFQTHMLFTFEKIEIFLKNLYSESVKEEKYLNVVKLVCYISSLQVIFCEEHRHLVHYSQTQ